MNGKRETRKKKYRYSSHGVRDDGVTCDLENGVISKYCSQDVMDDHAIPIVKEYTQKLINHELHNNTFTNRDGYIYDLVNQFFSSDFGTADAECNIMDLTRHIQGRRRSIFNMEFKDEKLMANIIRKSYQTGKRVKNEDTLQCMAWAVTHAYCTGLFMTERQIFDIVPKSNTELFPIWNQNIHAQSDIPDYVKNIFTIDQSGNCPYVSDRNGKYCVIGNDKQVETSPDASSDSWLFAWKSKASKIISGENADKNECLALIQEFKEHMDSLPANDAARNIYEKLLDRAVELP